MTEGKDGLEERIKAYYRKELPDELLLQPAVPATETERENYERELKERIARARQGRKQVGWGEALLLLVAAFVGLVIAVNHFHKDQAFINHTGVLSDQELWDLWYKAQYRVATKGVQLSPSPESPNKFEEIRIVPPNPEATQIQPHNLLVKLCGTHSSSCELTLAERLFASPKTVIVPDFGTKAFIEYMFERNILWQLGYQDVLPENPPD